MSESRDFLRSDKPKRYARLSVGPMTGKFLNYCGSDNSGIRFTIDGRKKGESFWVVVPAEFVTFEEVS